MTHDCSQHTGPVCNWENGYVEDAPVEIQGFANVPGDLLRRNRIYILVTWDEGMPLVRSYEDEHDAIEALKDSLPIRDRAWLFVSDETGSMGRVPGW